MFGKASLEQVKLYCAKAGISEQDAEWFWNKMEGNGWTNGGKPVKSWEKTLMAWKLAGYLASQRTGANGKPLAPPPATKLGQDALKLANAPIDYGYWKGKEGQ